jgi:serine/threonine protein kinase
MTEPYSRIGRYQIEEFLGSGTYAVVYRALDTVLQRTVALKVLKPVWARDREVSARFLREAQAAANLIHPNIAWVYDIGEDQDRHFIAARFIEGIALDRQLNEHGPLNWREALRVLAGVGSGLDYAHSQGIIHRDVKPQNILLSPADGAVLTDFGLTKAINEGKRLTQPGAIVGTPQYIPPEIWNGETATPAVDQYAMGCIFFEMLTGSMLFEGRVIETILQGQMNAGKLLGVHAEDLPEGAFEVLARALAYRPQDRYSSLSAFTAALDALGQKPGQAGGDLPSETVEGQAHSVVERRAARPPVEPETTRLEGQDKATAGLQMGEEWRSRLDRVYRQINPLSSGRLRATNTYGLVFSYEADAEPGEQPEKTGETLVIDREKILIGRSTNCDVMVDYPDVSRQHATLIQTDEGCLLKDMRSTNGTFVNGQQLRNEQLLKDGDEIRLGSTVRFIYQENA